MLLRSRFLACTLLAASVFGIDVRKSLAQAAPTSVIEPKYSETVEYTWSAKHVTVEFDRTSPDSSWVMTFRDSWSAIDQAKQQGKTWEESASRCVSQECIQFIDIALTRFQAAKPANKISEFAMEMQVNTELWREVLVTMRDALSRLKGHNPGGSFFPDSVIGSILQQERTSEITKHIVALLSKHGMIVGDFGLSSPPSLRPSLKGKSWSAIAELPDVGIDVPPMASCELSKHH